jgi:transglutaminase-like putative cysteine protease
MRIAISHTTRYRFDTPARYGVQRLRMRPRDCAVQSVLDWQLTVEGAVIEAAYDDHNGNATTLISLGHDVEEVVITANASVEVRDAAGVVGPHAGFMPLWLFANPRADQTGAEDARTGLALYAGRGGRSGGVARAVACGAWRGGL